MLAHKYWNTVTISFVKIWDFGTAVRHIIGSLVENEKYCKFDKKQDTLYRRKLRYNCDLLSYNSGIFILYIFFDENIKLECILEPL